MAVVRFQNVYKRYGANAPVITELNLEIRDREFLVLVGPSGCGKSTALRMIAGLEEITEGDLYIGDRRVNDVAPKDRDIAMVFQNYALYPHMSVFDNMAFSLQLRHVGKTEIEQRVRKAADMLGIGPYLQRKPKELSGGQRQRVALGRALVRNPQVFLMDEPLSNLDAQLRVQTRAEIAHLHQQVPVTTVYVTHDQVEAMTMGDRIAVLNAGVIQQLGTPAELYNTPANLFVAGFIGSPSMDFFTAKLLRQVSDTAVLDIAGHRLALSPELSAQLVGHATAEGRPVVAGVRPEDFSLATDGAANTLAGVVDVVEYLGSEQIVYMDLPGSMVPAATEAKSSTVRLSTGTPMKVGSRITLAVDVARLHIFDAETGKRFQ